MSLVLITPPATEPITLADAKAHLHVDDTADDAYITTLIAAARNLIEGQTSLAILPQTWRYTATGFPPNNGFIKLWKAPLTAVASINYVDSNGGAQVLSASQYVVDTDYILGRIGLKTNASWPSTAIQAQAVTMQFTAGYANAAAVPPSIIAALKLVLGDLYASREANIVGTNVVANPTVAALLDPWRLPVV